MLAPGETIDTVAASDLLVTFNWPEKCEHYRRVANFVNAFFSKFDRIPQTAAPPEMEGSEHNGGHTRLDKVQSRAGLDRQLARPAIQYGKGRASLASFKEFMAQHGHPNLSQEELAKLYAQFQEWNRRIKN